MTPLITLRKGSVALIVGALALSACGGGTPTAAPGTQVTPSSAVTTPPVTTPPVTQPPVTEPPASAPAATGGTAADPAEDLKIAAPYTLEPLDEQIAAVFVQAMSQAAGEMGDLFEFGFRSATKDGQSEAWVIVMAFPDLPITGKALLDQISNAAVGGGGTVEKTTIAGDPARVLTQGGQKIVLMLSGNDLLMIVGTSEKSTLNVAEAIGEAN